MLLLSLAQLSITSMSTSTGTRSGGRRSVPDHYFVHCGGHGLLLGALDARLVVAGDYELGVEVVGEPFAKEGHSQLETSIPIPCAEWLAFSFTSCRSCCRR